MAPRAEEVDELVDALSSSSMSPADSRRMSVERDHAITDGTHANLVIGTVVYALGRGVPMEAITEATGLTREDMVEQEGYFPEIVLPRIWLLIAGACPGEPVALQMASAAPLSIFGPMGHAARYAPDTRAILEIYTRFGPMLSQNLQLELVEREEFTEINSWHPMDAEDGGYMAELVVALAARTSREFIQDDLQPLVRAEFHHAPLGPEEAYREAFGVPVEFERPRNLLLFRSSLLDEPITHANAQMLKYLVEHLELVRERLMRLDGSDDLRRIRNAIADNAQRGEYGAERLARRLGMSLRSLQRLAQSHDTSVQALIDEAREAHARELLSNPKLSIQEVAFLVGYQSDRAFRRAFKRWTGSSPQELRARA